MMQIVTFSSLKNDTQTHFTQIFERDKNLNAFHFIVLSFSMRLYI